MWARWPLQGPGSAFGISQWFPHWGTGSVAPVLSHGAPVQDTLPSVLSPPARRCTPGDATVPTARSGADTTLPASDLRLGKACIFHGFTAVSKDRGWEALASGWGRSVWGSGLWAVGWAGPEGCCKNLSVSVLSLIN